MLKKAAGPPLLGNCSIVGWERIPRESGPSSLREQRPREGKPPRTPGDGASGPVPRSQPCNPHPRGAAAVPNSWDPAWASNRRCRRENPGNRPLSAGAVEKVTSAPAASHPHRRPGGEGLRAAGGSRRRPDAG